ncbi:alpha/beta hydrolase [Microbispora sp. NPDC049125]|uniref:alpha/beta hydrolase n=1 Tax=Microbispora sp. NPDC049125 TaxID=3154929 RepID=UPI00346587B4
MPPAGFSSYRFPACAPTRLAAQLCTGVLLTLNGEGRGAYGQNACIGNAVNGYLLDGKVPPGRTRCG